MLQTRAESKPPAVIVPLCANRRAAWLLAAATVLCLLPVLNRPFNIDEPLFIWAAQQIAQHPLDPYGFEVNWYQTAMPMWAVTQNPPLASYLLAAAGSLFGWSEVALHSVFLLPAIAVVVGTFFLAQSFCRQPAVVALATLFTPAFLACSATVMCDTLMLAFWVWALVFWRCGWRENKISWHLLAAVLIGAAALTKYFGICLVPLLAVDCWLHERKFTKRVACLLIPLLLLSAYEGVTRASYGRALFASAGTYVTTHRPLAGLLPQVLTGLAFAGGCVGVILFFMPLLWRERRWPLIALVVALPASWLFVKTTLPRFTLPDATMSRVSFATQWFVLAAGGAALLALVVAEVRGKAKSQVDRRAGSQTTPAAVFRSNRNPDAWLLVLWLLGTLCFASFVNWTINARSMLPLIPTAAILLVRRLDAFAPTTTRAHWLRFAPSLALSAALALGVMWEDAERSRDVHDATRVIHESYGHGPGQLWVCGHWGFQYYLQLAGAHAYDPRRDGVRPGDFLAVPDNNTNVVLPPADAAKVVDKFYVPCNSWLDANRRRLGAGFYSSHFGPLPFVFARVPPLLYEVRQFLLSSVK